MQDPVGRLHEHPALSRRSEPRIEAECVAHEVVELGERLDAGVPRADEHEREVRCFGREVGGLELREHVVAKRDGIGQVVEPERVLGEPRDGERARDRAEREHEPLVAQLEPSGVRLDRDGASVLVERGRGTNDELRAGAHHPQRHDDVPRLERGRGGFGEQWPEEHEVLGAHDRRLSDMPGEDASGIASADDQRPVSGLAFGHGDIVAAWPQFVCASSMSSAARRMHCGP